MIKERVIPCLNVKDRRAVRDIRFQSLRDIGNPVDLALYYNEVGADGLVLFDISKTEAGHDFMMEVIETAAKQLFIPLTVGGGIQDLDDIIRPLNHRADKILLNSSALKRPELIRQASEKLDRQCTCVAIDSFYDKNRKGYFCTTHGGKKLADIRVYDWVQEVELLDAGELLITNMHHDGAKQGFDIEHLVRIKQLVNIPIIASGGGENAQHLVELFRQTSVSVGLAASILYGQEATVAEIRDKMREGGILVR